MEFQKSIKHLTAATLLAAGSLAICAPTSAEANASQGIEAGVDPEGPDHVDCVMTNPDGSVVDCSTELPVGDSTPQEATNEPMPATPMPAAARYTG
ncbi:hypothetical protein A3D14_01540 [Candidatus Saccharibacteria bacterium RIFCSPHIGHO2_02_FULL_47_12]|nr:MAG: hypothetical protein A3D14_01540 [Candidatus Saccharibacteria bacterium RIFCSPHIGHO2_02_FULL_47_12]